MQFESGSHTSRETKQLWIGLWANSNSQQPGNRALSMGSACYEGPEAIMVLARGAIHLQSRLNPMLTRAIHTQSRHTQPTRCTGNSHTITPHASTPRAATCNQALPKHAAWFYAESC